MLKMANPGLFFVYFRSFQTNITIFTTNTCEKMSIQYTVPGIEPSLENTPHQNFNLLGRGDLCYYGHWKIGLGVTFCSHCIG